MSLLLDSPDSERYKDSRSLFDDLQDEIPFLNEQPYVPVGNKWLSLIETASAHTPDFRELKNDKRGEFLILVTDNLQKGRAINYLLQGANYYGRGETAWNGFVLKKNRDGVAVPFRMHKVGYKGTQGYRYPSGHHCMRTQDVGCLEGDIYGVPLRLLATIDNIRKNTEKCNRQTNLVQFLHSRQKNQYAKAFVWEGDHEYYDKFETSPQFMPSCSMKIRANTNVLFY